MSIIDFTLYTPRNHNELSREMMEYLSQMKTRFVAFMTHAAEPSIHDMDKNIDYTGYLGFDEFKKLYPLK